MGITEVKSSTAANHIATASESNRPSRALALAPTDGMARSVAGEPKPLLAPATRVAPSPPRVPGPGVLTRFDRVVLRRFPTDEVFPAHISDYATRAMAQRINGLFARSNADAITARHILQIDDMFAKRNDGKKTPLDGLHERALENLKKQLPTLVNQLEPKRKTAELPWTHTLVVDAIRLPRLRACAAALAEQYNSGRAEVRLVDIEAAEHALGEIDTNVKHFSNVIGSKVLNAPSVTAEALRELKLFMQTGEGDMINWGPMTINTHRFEEVFRLNMTAPLAVKVPALADGEISDEAAAKQSAALAEKDEAAMKQSGTKAAADADHIPAKPAPIPPTTGTIGIDQAALTTAISQYQERFQGSGYDNIYMIGADGQLYVAINGHGSLEQVVKRRDRVYLGGADGNPQQPATVVWVSDVTNSWSEATISKAVKYALDIDTTLNKELDTTTGAVFDNLSSDIVPRTQKNAGSSSSAPPSRAAQIGATIGGSVLLGAAGQHLPNLKWDLDAGAVMIGLAALFYVGRGALGYGINKRRQSRSPYLNTAIIPNWELKRLAGGRGHRQSLAS